ncbi:MAG TPA: hypothetical protein VGF40_03775 [Thermoanaerobaculia bacterium]
MRVVYAILLAAMIVGGFQPFFLRILFSDRGAIARRLAEAPDRPGYVAFLREVRRRTPEGSRIAILVPMRHWGRGYSYAYYRASYFLTGREVVPVVDPDDSAHLERVRGADFVASWGMAPRIAGFAAVWNGDGSVLLERSGP